MIKGKTRRGEDVWYIRDPKTGRYYPLRPGKEENHGWSCRNCSEKNTKRARIGQIKRSKRRAYLPKWYRREDKSFIPNAYDNHFDTCIPITVEEMIAEQLANGNENFPVENVEAMDIEESHSQQMDQEVQIAEPNNLHSIDRGNRISDNDEERMNNSSEMVDGIPESDRFGDFDDVPENSEIVQNGVARVLLDGDNRVKLGVEVLDGFENAQNWNDLNEDGGDDDRFFDAMEFDKEEEGDEETVGAKEPREQIEEEDNRASTEWNENDYLEGCHVDLNDAFIDYNSDSRPDRDDNENGDDEKMECADDFIQVVVDVRNDEDEAASKRDGVEDDGKVAGPDPQQIIVAVSPTPISAGNSRASSVRDIDEEEEMDRYFAEIVAAAEDARQKELEEEARAARRASERAARRADRRDRKNADELEAWWNSLGSSSPPAPSAPQPELDSSFWAQLDDAPQQSSSDLPGPSTSASIPAPLPPPNAQPPSNDPPSGRSTPIDTEKWEF